LARGSLGSLDVRASLGERQGKGINSSGVSVKREKGKKGERSSTLTSVWRPGSLAHDQSHASRRPDLEGGGGLSETGNDYLRPALLGRVRSGVLSGRSGGAF